MPKTVININKAIEFILYELYTKEFVVIDGYNQHEDGLTFEEWLEKYKLVEE